MANTSFQVYLERRRDRKKGKEDKEDLNLARGGRPPLQFEALRHPVRRCRICGRFEAISRLLDHKCPVKKEYVGMSQETLDLFEGEKAKEEGMASVAGNEEEWMKLAVRVIKEVARDNRDFTMQQVRLEFLWQKLPKPSSQNAWGAAMNRVARSGFIVKTGEYRQSGFKAAHARPLAVWKINDQFKIERV